MSDEFTRLFRKQWWGWHLRDGHISDVTVWQISGGTYQVNLRGWPIKTGISLPNAQTLAVQLFRTYIEDDVSA